MTATAFDILYNKNKDPTTRMNEITNVREMEWRYRNEISLYMRVERNPTLTDRRNMGNSANHSTANNIRPNTCMLDGRRDAKSTDAKMAALVANDPGNVMVVMFVEP